MPTLRQCIEELIRETPGDLLARLDITLFFYHYSVCFLYFLGNFGVVAQVLGYGIKMFKIIGRMFLSNIRDLVFCREELVDCDLQTRVPNEPKTVGA